MVTAADPSQKYHPPCHQEVSENTEDNISWSVCTAFHTAHPNYMFMQCDCFLPCAAQTYPETPSESK